MNQIKQIGDNIYRDIKVIGRLPKGYSAFTSMGQTRKENAININGEIAYGIFEDVFQYLRTKVLKITIPIKGRGGSTMSAPVSTFENKGVLVRGTIFGIEDEIRALKVSDFSTNKNRIRFKHTNIFDFIKNNPS